MLWGVLAALPEGLMSCLSSLCRHLQKPRAYAVAVDIRVWETECHPAYMCVCLCVTALAKLSLQKSQTSGLGSKHLMLWFPKLESN